MDNELLKKAKKLVLNKFGKALAEKATDEFCLNILRSFLPRSTRAFALESISEKPATSSESGFIMEFKEVSVKSDRGGRQSAAFKEKFAKLTRMFTTEEGVRINVQEVLREIKLKSHRENILKTIHPLNAYLERSIERAFAHGKKSLQQQSFLTKVCWLNQTVKTIADPKSLSEIATDPNINKLDLPRKLVREIHETGKVIFAPQYREKFNRSGKGIIVAVIDLEIASNLKAFGNRVLHRSNYTKEPWGNPDSHGTGVAGIIGSGDTSFIGMAPDVTIYNYKVLATDPFLDTDDFQATLAIQKALEDGAHLANCSWGAGPASDGTSREARACNTAWDLGLTIIKSAGNKGPASSTLTTPADARGVIVVGATGKDGKRVENYSSRGPLISGEHRPHLLAPGGSPTQGIFSCLTGGGFDSIGFGTSFAAPHVTGLLALILENDNSLAPEEQRTLLLSLCQKLTEFDIDSQGEGLISLASLL